MVLLARRCSFSWFLRNDEPHNEVQQQATTSDQCKGNKNESYDDWIDVEILPQAATHAAQYSLVLGAIELLCAFRHDDPPYFN